MKTEAVSKALVINARNEALILTVGLYLSRPDKSFKPDLPGGMVDPGETPLVAVRRELWEEAGISLDESAFALAYEKEEVISKERKTVTKYLYVARVAGTPKVSLSWEHARYAWVSIDALASVELRPFYRAAVDYCVENGLLLSPAKTFDAERD